MSKFPIVLMLKIQFLHKFILEGLVFILDWIRDNKSVESNKPNAGELQLLILVGLTKIKPDVILFNIGGTIVQIRKEIANQFLYLTGLIEIQSNKISFIDRDGQNFLGILKHVEQGIFDQLPKYLLENADFFGCRVKSDSNYCIICMCEMKCGAICHQICQECNKSHQQCILCGQGRNSNKRLFKNNKDFIERQVKSSMAYNSMNSDPQITKFRTVKRRATHSNMYYRKSAFTYYDNCWEIKIPECDVIDQAWLILQIHSGKQKKTLWDLTKLIQCLVIISEGQTLVEFDFTMWFIHSISDPEYILNVVDISDNCIEMHFKITDFPWEYLWYHDASLKIKVKLELDYESINYFGLITREHQVSREELSRFQSNGHEITAHLTKHLTRLFDTALDGHTIRIPLDLKSRTRDIWLIISYTHNTLEINPDSFMITQNKKPLWQLDSTFAKTLFNSATCHHKTNLDFMPSNFQCYLIPFDRNYDRFDDYRYNDFIGLEPELDLELVFDTNLNIQHDSKFTIHVVWRHFAVFRRYEKMMSYIY